MKTIVGNLFKDFSDETSNLTLDDFFLNKEHYSDERMILGQGLSRFEVNKIKEISKINNIKLFNDPISAECHITHKHKVENSIISIPVKINNHEYESCLCIDDNSELLLDHQTGLHIQGMALIEACRQMFIAVAMDYFSDNYFDDHRYGSINSMDIKFENFLFPLPAKIIYKRLNVIKNEEKDSVGFKAIIIIQQAEKIAMTMVVEHTYYRKDKINSIEKYKSNSACKRLVDYINNFKD